MSHYLIINGESTRKPEAGPFTTKYPIPGMSKATFEIAFCRFEQRRPRAYVYHNIPEDNVDFVTRSLVQVNKAEILYVEQEKENQS